MKSQRWKDILDFTAREKRGVIILIGILLVVIGLKVLQPWDQNKEAIDFSAYESDIDRFESDLAAEPEAQYQNYPQQKSDNDRYAFNFQTEKFDFNPNEVSKDTMKSLGFSDALVDNILNYRKAGGMFFQTDDLEKLYTMDEAFFETIEPFIRFDDDQSENQQFEHFAFNPNVISKDSLILLGFPEFIADRWVNFRSAGAGFATVNDIRQIYGIDTLLVNELRDYMIFPKNETENIESHEIPELNTCEFRDLVRIDGISSSTASKVLSYRKLLGGYVQHEQLLEVYDMTTESYQILIDKTIIDPAAITKIPVNQAEFSDLLRHPYLNTKEVKAIMNYRDFKGRITELEALIKNKLISDSTYNKIHQYLSTE
ncbi:MAG: helix-hairpin-helix domain-containing protein [Bacteroidales bacterium]|jgi:DNA uptake protein ComE-like DNA-binding protein|nr:helix-hairpin-helix domain-containing protein [Bacteroidales bacterium]